MSLLIGISKCALRLIMYFTEMTIGTLSIYCRLPTNGKKVAFYLNKVVIYSRVGQYL